MDLNGDGLLDVAHSTTTMQALLASAPKGFELTIINDANN
jgi:hypothetical protein